MATQKDKKHASLKASLSASNLLKLSG